MLFALLLITAQDIRNYTIIEHYKSIFVYILCMHCEKYKQQSRGVLSD